MNLKTDDQSAPMASMIRIFLRVLWGILFIAAVAFGGFLLLRLILVEFGVPLFLERYISEIGQLAGFDSQLTWVLFVIVTVLVTPVVRKALKFAHPKRDMARLTLAGLLVVGFAVHWFLSRDQLLDKAGKPRFYWCLKPDGSLYKQSSAGSSPFDGEALEPASWDYWVLLNQRCKLAPEPVDPATAQWFDHNSGQPLLWYYHATGEKWEFYPRPMYHPRHQAKLQPVSPATLQQWEQDSKKEQAARTAADVKARQEEEMHRKATAEEAAKTDALRLEHERLATERARLEVEAAKANQAAAEADQAKAEAEHAKAEAERQTAFRDHQPVHTDYSGTSNEETPNDASVGSAGKSSEGQDAPNNSRYVPIMTAPVFRSSRIVVAPSVPRPRSHFIVPFPGIPQPRVIVPPFPRTYVPGRQFAPSNPQPMSRSRR